MLHPQSASDTAGRFRVLLHLGETKTIWDRQIRGSFPDLKELKQIYKESNSGLSEVLSFLRLSAAAQSLSLQPTASFFARMIDKIKDSRSQ